MTNKELPEAELDVMGCLWSQGPLTAAEIRQALQKQRPMAHASVCTLLRRLEEKNFVRRKKSGVGKSFSYEAIAQQRRIAPRLLNDLLKRVFGGDRMALVASLLETQTLDLDDIRELEQLVENLKAKNASKMRSKRGNS